MSIKAGESKTLTFTLLASKLSFYDANGDELLQKGAFKVFVGTNSDDLLSSDFVPE